ncbi:hypothetical protein BPAE_0041g00260 [Botrytis paeoniae]|uniref:Uncharacterized protein n=1 Tax=Botrytis paeoniae TaxID=278948 RepID=A0A4Z1FRY4_9HELO|nr:hypothetical protein BPAE_0041g00260 [Botrytis paeoniae]
MAHLSFGNIEQANMFRQETEHRGISIFGPQLAIKFSPLPKYREFWISEGSSRPKLASYAYDFLASEGPGHVAAA